MSERNASRMSVFSLTNHFARLYLNRSWYSLSRLVTRVLGNFYLANSEGEEIMIEKTLVFRRCNDGKLRLSTHKSALPYDRRSDVCNADGREIM